MNRNNMVGPVTHSAAHGTSCCPWHIVLIVLIVLLVTHRAARDASCCS
jgi:hypothetical protein